MVRIASTLLVALLLPLLAVSSLPADVYIHPSQHIRNRSAGGQGMCAYASAETAALARGYSARGLTDRQALEGRGADNPRLDGAARMLTRMGVPIHRGTGPNHHVLAWVERCVNLGYPAVIAYTTATGAHAVTITRFSSSSIHYADPNHPGTTLSMPRSQMQAAFLGSAIVIR